MENEPCFTHVVFYVQEWRHSPNTRHPFASCLYVFDTSMQLPRLLYRLYKTVEKPGTEYTKSFHKRTNSDLQNTTHKTKNRATRILLKSGVNSGDPEG
jgi:hypothetical protein